MDGSGHRTRSTLRERSLASHRPAPRLTGRGARCDHDPSMLVRGSRLSRLGASVIPVPRRSSARETLVTLRCRMGTAASASVAPATLWRLNPEAEAPFAAEQRLSRECTGDDEVPPPDG